MHNFSGQEKKHQFDDFSRQSYGWVRVEKKASILTSLVVKATEGRKPSHALDN